MSTALLVLKVYVRLTPVCSAPKENIGLLGCLFNLEWLASKDQDRCGGLSLILRMSSMNGQQSLLRVFVSLFWSCTSISWYIRQSAFARVVLACALLVRHAVKESRKRADLSQTNLIMDTGARFLKVHECYCNPAHCQFATDNIETPTRCVDRREGAHLVLGSKTDAHDGEVLQEIHCCMV